MMNDLSIDEIVSEESFAAMLQERSASFFRLSNTFLASQESDWTRRHPYLLIIEADSLESFLDDHGAPDNRTYHLFRELVASVRGLAMAAFSLSHLLRRLGSYATNLVLYPEREEACRAALARAHTIVRSDICSLLQACEEEGRSLGMLMPDGVMAPDSFEAPDQRVRLPRNLGEEVIDDEEQRIAEVASKYLQVCEMFQRINVQPIEDDGARESYFAQFCTEERARVYEATVHNLQSAYDTFIKNTVLEGEDERLPRLRGHVSAAFHLLEAVTQLVHFVERHESGAGEEGSSRRISKIVDRSQIRDITLNTLLFWASEFIDFGKPIAEELLPAYTNVQDLVVELSEEMIMHARPAALIVGIVHRYGTPVELQVGDAVCDASSILDLMIAVGSNASERKFIFRGDENPLHDIRLLFEHQLGENGLSQLPEQLSYLR